MTTERVSRLLKDRILITSIILLFLLSSCSSFPANFSQINNPEFQLAEVLFKVRLPEELTPEAKLMLEVLDDVTGVYFNAARYEMARDDATHYSVRIPQKVATEVKYRYVRVIDSDDYEQTASGQQVRFRIARLDGPQIIEDIIEAWPDRPYNAEVGRISGQAIDQATKAPIPNLLIIVGGSQTTTASDGSFQVTQLTPGVHNLVIYSMDGSYETFQQGALIAEGANTPALVYLDRRPTTRVRFEVVLPRDHPKDLPLRFVSNLSNLGNAYADLSSGSAGAAVNYPSMTKVTENRYYMDLDLPVGMFLRYKYSFGDGFWNTELTNEGHFVTRDLIIQEDQVIQDRVQNFHSPQIAPVKISIKVPDATPAQEKVYIQFKPFDWTEPLPMVARGSGIWEYTLYSPMQFTNALEYRFCRNGLCEISTGETSGVMVITPLTDPQTITNTVVEWDGLTKTTIDSTEYLEFEVSRTRLDFLAGIEFTPAYLPGWRAVVTPGLEFSHELGGDYVILSPTGSVNQADQPEINILPGKDLQWSELMTMINHVTMSGQKTILYPQLNYTQGAVNFFSADDWSDEFKDAWFEQYQRFLAHNADLAQIMDVEGMVLAEPSTPYLEYAQKSIDTNAVQRGFRSDQWSAIISDLRQRFDGKLIGVVTFGNATIYVPSWLDQVDMIYVLFSPAFEFDDGSVNEIRQHFDSILDESVQLIYLETGKPILVGISYPSSIQARFGLPTSNEFQLVAPEDSQKDEPDLELQAKIYSAAIQSSAARDWISGFISRGYFPYVELQDTSSSIYRKPASDILWFWYHYLLNKAP